MGVAEVARFEGVGGIETVLVRLWKCVEKPKRRIPHPPTEIVRLISVQEHGTGSGKLYQTTSKRLTLPSAK